MSGQAAEPTVTRTASMADIRFEITAGTHAWEVIRIQRTPAGAIEMFSNDSATGCGNLTIPASVLPFVLAELDRIAAADEPAPFEPVAARAHVTLVGVAELPVPVAAVDEAKVIAEAFCPCGFHAWLNEGATDEEREGHYRDVEDHYAYCDLRMFDDEVVQAFDVKDRVA